MANDTLACRNNVVDFSGYISLNQEFSDIEKKGLIRDNVESKIFFESLALVLMTVLVGSLLFLAFDKLMDLALYLAPLNHR